MPPAVTFRAADAADAPALAAFVNATYHGPDAARGWTPETHLHRGPRTSVEEIAGLIADPKSHVVVAEDANGLAGCAVIETRGETGHFGMFAVRTASQGEGLGKSIMAEAERCAVALWGCRAMALSVMSPQDKLLAYYERRGYRQTGEREPFPFDQAPGALRRDYNLMVMRKNLT